MPYIAQLVCIYLIDIPEPVQYVMYTQALTFDLKCEIVTFIYYN